MRHVHGESQCGALVLAQPQFQQARGAARHLQPVNERPVPLGQLGPGRMRGYPKRPGVRDSHRDAMESDRQPHAERERHGADGTGEAIPHVVGLRAVEQQERDVRGVVHQVDG